LLSDFRHGSQQPVNAVTAQHSASTPEPEYWNDNADRFCYDIDTHLGARDFSQLDSCVLGFADTTHWNPHKPCPKRKRKYASYQHVAFSYASSAATYLPKAGKMKTIKFHQPVSEGCCPQKTNIPDPPSWQ